jgi:hypothetical protein
MKNREKIKFLRFYKYFLFAYATLESFNRVLLVVIIICDIPELDWRARTSSRLIFVTLVIKKQGRVVG